MTKRPNSKGDNVQPDERNADPGLVGGWRFRWRIGRVDTRVVGAYLAVGAWGALVLKAVTDTAFDPPQMIYAVPAAAGWFLWRASKEANGGKETDGKDNGGA